MKRIIALALVICAFTVMARPAGGDFYTGNDLHEWCGSARDQGRCLGYVGGAYDAHQMHLNNRQDKKRLCVPGAVSPQQIVNVVKQYLVEHSEKRHFMASMIVGLAAAEAWPCR